jgi:hypothetical protein
MKFVRVVDIIGWVLQLLYSLLDVHHLSHLIDEVDIDKLIKNSCEISINDDTSTNGTSNTAFDSINLQVYLQSVDHKELSLVCLRSGLRGKNI